MKEIKDVSEKDLISHCGLYCGACRAYLLEKKNLFAQKGYKRGCKGCITQNKNCVHIKKGCKYLKNGEVHFCFECEEFPCQKIERLDHRYKKKYDVSLIDNLKRIKEIGIREWLREQKNLYTCPKCSGEICVHDAECFDCGYQIL